MTLSCSVIIASTNRPQLLKETILSIAKQTLLPKEVVISAIKQEDFPQALNLDLLPFKVKYLISLPGLSCQRNFGFKALTQKTDFVSFFDDDIILHHDYLLKMSSIFLEYKNCICAMGPLLANGNICLEDAKSLCTSPPSLGENTNKYYATSASWGSLYGCI